MKILWLPRKTLTVLFALVLLSPVSGIAAGPSLEQVKQFQALSPAQQSALKAAYLDGGRLSIKKVPALEMPQTVVPVGQQRNRQTEESSIEKSAEDSVDNVTLDEEKKEKKLTTRLKQFGYDLFAGQTTTFAPVSDIPVPSDYVIGPGDTLQIYLFGKESTEHHLQVNREGRLNFPGIGPIQVAGMHFNELKKSLHERIAKQMIGVRASITMGGLRSIRVFILGDVLNPGSYTVSALSTMTNALFVSGGVARIGSLRNIQLKRRDRKSVV